MEDPATTCFILEAWQPAPAVYNKKSREINVCESSGYGQDLCLLPLSLEACLLISETCGLTPMS